MCDMQTRMTEVYHRANQRRKQRQARQITALSGLCCGMFGLNIAFIAYVSCPKQSYRSADWMYGAMLLPSDASSYIVVAVITFVVATAITITCMKTHEKFKNKQEEKTP